LHLGYFVSIPFIFLFCALPFVFDSFVGIKQVMFGGAEFESWNENLKSEEAGYGVHKI